MELVIARFGFRKRKRRAKAIDVAVKKTEELRKQYGLDALFFPGGSSGVGIEVRSGQCDSLLEIATGFVDSPH